PALLLPHAIAVPVLSKARLSAPPPESSVAPVRPLTATGTLLFVVVPLPSCPLLFNPQAIAVALLSRARLWVPPAAIPVTPEMPRRADVPGAVRGGPVALPSVGVFAERNRRAVAQEREAVSDAGGDSRQPAETAPPHGEVRRCGGAVAELTGAVSAPRNQPGRAFRGQRWCRRHRHRDRQHGSGRRNQRYRGRRAQRRPPCPEPSQKTHLHPSLGSHEERSCWLLELTRKARRASR